MFCYRYRDTKACKRRILRSILGVSGENDFMFLLTSSFLSGRSVCVSNQVGGDTIRYGITGSGFDLAGSVERGVVRSYHTK